MKFYELIELGSTLVASRKHGNTCYCCCVIGTACAAIGVDAKRILAKELYSSLQASIGPGADIYLPCPVCTAFGGRDYRDHFRRSYPEASSAQLLWLADHLHTTHHWERQRIAEFIKPHEDAYMPPVTDELPTTVIAIAR